MGERLRVVAAAILHGKTIYSMPAPARHHDVCGMMIAQGLSPEATRDQGFLLSDGRFCSRKAACRIALRAKQLVREKTYPKHLLFSEDVW